MTKPNEEKLTYEEAYEELESIVKQLEEDEPPLNDLVSLYEKGTQLLGVCQKRLSEASLRLKEVEENEKAELRDFETGKPTDL